MRMESMSEGESRDDIRVQGHVDYMGSYRTLDFTLVR